MRKYNKNDLTVGLITVCSIVALLSGCTKENDVTPAVSQSSDAMEQSETSFKETEFSEDAEQTGSDTLDDLSPEAGYYSNDYDEILKIEKLDDGTYNIEYSVYKLLYVESATGIYDPESGKIHFNGKDDGGNVLEADIENMGNHLQVTVTQSSHEDIVGTTQDFYPAEEPQ